MKRKRKQKEKKTLI